MNIITELASQRGVIAAGEYSYRGDRFSYEGQLDDEKARMASIMCRATTMAVHMQTDMMHSLKSACGCAPARGWVVRGKQFSVCVIANVFCFIGSDGSLDDIVKLMRQKVPHQEGQLI